MGRAGSGETELDAALYVTRITRVAAVEQVSVPAGRAGKAPVWTRCGHGVTPVRLPWGSIPMGASPGPLRSLAGKTPSMSAGKAQGCTQLPNRQQGASSIETASCAAWWQRSLALFGCRYPLKSRGLPYRRASRPCQRWVQGSGPSLSTTSVSPSRRHLSGRSFSSQR